ncbi:MAG: OmpA family protein [Verrucomicrobiota bacterium]
MKTNQMIFPLVLALVATLAATGCKKGPIKPTPLPGSRPQVGTDGGPGTLPPGGTLPGGDTNAGSGPGGGPLANLDGFDGIKDPAALAAHTVLFAFDSAVVKKGEQSKISAVAAALASNTSDKLIIEGNCDERGTEEYNRTLGERRALALREALSKAGVSPDRIRTISYGKDKPVDPGHTEAAWSKNRRGDFILVHPKTGV